METLNASVASVASVASAETVKRDPLSQYKNLSSAEQNAVDTIVSGVLDQIGGANNIDLNLLLGILDKLNAEKKTARENAKSKEKEQKEARKAMAEAKGEQLKNTVNPGDTITYFAATAKVTFTTKVMKVTDKCVRIEIDADTSCIDKTGKVMKAGDIPTLKLGMKSVAFSKIATINGLDPFAEDDDTAEVSAKVAE